jgi:SAM-dependent methyltransferase
MKITSLARFLFVLTLVASLAACQTRPHSRPSALLQEESVRPGINAELLNPDLNPAQWVERFEREGREVYDQRHAIIRATQVRPGMAVADIGAGTGLFVPLFAEAVGPRGRVYAVDIVQEFLTLIDDRMQKAGIQNVRTMLATERSVELPPNSIDLAFICDTYHHFEYPQSTLASLHRALRPNGQLVVLDFKRIPGESSDWVLNHVRAGQEVFTAEIEAAGFEQIEQVEGLLKQNYMVRFRKVRK